MPCYSPLHAWQSRSVDDFNEATGKRRMVFKREHGIEDTYTQLPCGKCIGCRLDKSRSWAVRILHEASLWPENSFLTLTYNDANLPSGGSLNREDIQKFFKRLRKRLANEQISIRYFQVGEYGDENQRPHHHVILFNYGFPDKTLLRNNHGVPIYFSPLLEELWPFGFHTIGAVTFDSAAYCARYCLKKIGGPKAEEHYKGKAPEFSTMSRRPGIGAEWIKKFMDDVYNHDRVVVEHDWICRPPKYYDGLHEQLHPLRHEEHKVNRKQQALNPTDKTDERLIERHKVALHKQDKVSRFYEQPQKANTKTV